MNHPILASEIVKKIYGLNFTQKEDVLHYVNRFSGNSTKDNYRKNAIREIKKALKISKDF